jgi:hypothetical protein
MAYTLTLSRGEREALEWVGHRDWTGGPLYDILNSEGVLWDGANPYVDDGDWEGYWRNSQDITFTLPEYKAWEIRELWEEAGELIPHLDSDFTHKLFDLFNEIV